MQDALEIYVYFVKLPKSLITSVGSFRLPSIYSSVEKHIPIIRRNQKDLGKNYCHNEQNYSKPYSFGVFFLSTYLPRKGKEEEGRETK